MIAALIIIAAIPAGIIGGLASFFAWLWWDSRRLVRAIRLRQQQQAVSRGKGWYTA